MCGSMRSQTLILINGVRFFFETKSGKITIRNRSRLCNARCLVENNHSWYPNKFNNGIVMSGGVVILVRRKEIMIRVKFIRSVPVAISTINKIPMNYRLINKRCKFKIPITIHQIPKTNPGTINPIHVHNTPPPPPQTHY